MDALTPGGEARRRELEAILVLQSLPGVGSRGVWALLRAAGSAGGALRDGALLEAWGGAAAAAGARDPAVRRTVLGALAVADRLGMGTLLHHEERYPRALHHLADPPPVLFHRGRVELLDRPGVAVVGSRRATARARSVAARISAAVARAGTPVVSGMALGVDGAAHQGALDAAGPTVAVLGCGADRPYPSRHAPLFRRILDRGLVVSEFLPGTPALPHHFPRRNRILAALSRILVVVEAGARSGALITVDHALDLGVEVWAVPGPVDEPACAGSNGLLGDGARALVSVPAFVEAALGGDGVTMPLPALDLRTPQGLVWQALGDGCPSADQLVRTTGLPAGRVMGALAALELAGTVIRLPGMRFRRAG